MYTLKNLKTFKGHEGEPLAQGTLWDASMKVADWSDDFTGGPMRVDFVSKAEEALFVVFARTYLMEKPDFEGKPRDTSAMHEFDLIETAVAEMSYLAEQEREEAKQAKKGIAYYRQGAGATGKSLYVWTAAYTAENVKTVRDKFPDLVEIINERLGMPFVDGEQFKLAERNKRWKRLCKTVIVFTVRDAKGQVTEMKRAVAYSAAQAASLRAKYPNLVEIINERFV